jgi:hypothetical protein
MQAPKPKTSSADLSLSPDFFSLAIEEKAPAALYPQSFLTRESGA